MFYCNCHRNPEEWIQSSALTIQLRHERLRDTPWFAPASRCGAVRCWDSSPWFLGGNGSLCSPYTIPNNSLHSSFPHSLLRTRQSFEFRVQECWASGFRLKGLKGSNYQGLLKGSWDLVTRVINKVTFKYLPQPFYTMPAALHTSAVGSPQRQVTVKIRPEAGMTMMIRRKNQEGPYIYIYTVWALGSILFSTVMELGPKRPSQLWFYGSP